MSPQWSISQFLIKRYFYLFSLFVFFLPLLFMPDFNEAFEFPKLMAVYMFTSLLVVLFFFDIAFVKGTQFEGFKSNISKALLIYTAAFGLSTLFSYHFYTSITGYYTRFNDGFLSIITFMGIYLVAINTLKKNEIKQLLEVLTLSVLMVGSYGILQRLGLFNDMWSGETTERIFSTFGQPNWLAQYLGILLTLNIYFLAKRNELIWIIIYIIGYAALWFTYSISGFLGFMLGVVLMIKVLRDKGLIAGNKRKLIGLLLFSIFLSVLFPGIFYAKIHDAVLDISKRTQIISDSSTVYAADTDTYGDNELTVPVGKVTDEAVNQVSDPGFIRLGMWKGTLDLIFSSPKNFLLGTGPETFAYFFQFTRPESLNYSSEWEYVINKPHNYYLEIWAESGILTLVTYVALGFILFRHSPAYIKPSLAVFYFTNLFGWPTVVITLIWWLFIIRMTISEEKDD